MQQQENDITRLSEITEAWIGVLLDDCARQDLASGDVRELLGATGRAMAMIAARYAPPKPEQPFTWDGDIPAPRRAVFVSCALPISVGDRVRAECYDPSVRGNVACEGEVVDIVVGRYLAKGVTEVDYLLRYGDYQEQWVTPAQVTHRMEGGIWVDLCEDGAR